MVIGRTKTEMKAKFRDLRRDLDSGAGNFVITKRG